jgi:hypothetical protein
MKKQYSRQCQRFCEALVRPLSPPPPPPPASFPRIQKFCSDGRRPLSKEGRTPAQETITVLCSSPFCILIVRYRLYLNSLGLSLFLFPPSSPWSRSRTYRSTDSLVPLSRKSLDWSPHKIKSYSWLPSPSSLSPFAYVYSWYNLVWFRYK